MTKPSLWTLLAAAVLCASAVAQNELFHFDGTVDATSRGSNGNDAKTFLQRIPGDQAGGATAVVEHVFTLQDQEALTPETFTVEIRANDPAVPGGAPDMTATGLLGFSGPFTVTFPCASGICAAVFTITHASPIAVPSADTPDGDFYVACATPPSPGWSATDGLSCWVSGAFFGGPGEQMNPDATGYPPAPMGGSGLGWQWDATLMTPPDLASGNRSWSMTTRFVDDVSQPFASNAGIFTGAPAGSNPNFGYAGLWPDMTRPDSSSDAIGIRVRTTNPVGTPVFLIVGFSSFDNPKKVYGVGGFLMVAPPYVLTPAVTTVAAPPDQPLTTSEAIFGPAAGDPSFGGLDIYVQGISNGTSGLVLSTMSKIDIEN